MVIQKSPVKIDKIVSLKIGQRGENQATEIKMDVSDWIAIHPDANFYCLFKRPGEAQVQPVLSGLEDNILTWTVSAWECARIGVGLLEVRAIVRETVMVAKSRMIPCAVEDTILDDTDPVPPEMGWVDEVLTAKDAAIEARDDAIEAKDAAQDIVSGAIEDMQAEAATQIGRVQAKGDEIIDSLPPEYTEITSEVSDLKSAISDTNSLINVELALGHITSSRAVSWITGDLIAGNAFLATDYVDVSKYSSVEYARIVRDSPSSTVGMAFYDENKAYIPDSGQSSFVGDPSVTLYILTVIKVPVGAVYARFSGFKSNQDGLFVKGVTLLNEKIAGVDAQVTSVEKKFSSYQTRMTGMRNIAYSLVGIAPINTLEHYLSVAKLGFNCIKGDVRLTSDNKLVMCHDAGFTLSSNGRITTYSASDNTPIRNMTESQVLALEHSTYRDQLGYYAHPCTFEDYIKACKETGLPPFVTLRNEYIDTIVPLVFSVLKKYRLEDVCIINSFDKSTLLSCRAEYPYVKVSWVQSPDTLFTTALIDEAAEIGNCILSLQQTDFTGYDTQIEYAISKGVDIYTAILYSYADYQKSIKAGVTGCQIGRMIMTYKPTLYAFKVSVSNGVISFRDYFNGNRFLADISDHIADSNSIYIQNIRENGTERTFSDGIMPTWLNSMPYRLSVKESSGAECSIRWAHQTNVNRLVINCQQLSQSDCTFEIIVEV